MEKTSDQSSELKAPASTSLRMNITASAEAEDVVVLEFPLELRNQDYLRRIMQMIRPGIKQFYDAVIDEGAAAPIDTVDGMEPTMMEYIRHMGQNGEDYADVLDRLPAFIMEHYQWLIEAVYAIEYGGLYSEYAHLFQAVLPSEGEQTEEDTGEGKAGAAKDSSNSTRFVVKEANIRTALGNSAALMSILGDQFETQWILDNLNLFRAQYNSHLKLKRERFSALMNEGATAESARGDRPIVNPDGSLTFTYNHDFDKNGILYYIGTDGLTTSWANPAEKKEVFVVRSSNGSGADQNFVGREAIYTSTDYREPNQWFRVDFGQFRRIYPTRYTLRHGSEYGVSICIDLPI